MAREARRALEAAGFARARVFVRADLGLDVVGLGEGADDAARDRALEVVRKITGPEVTIHLGDKPRPAPSPTPTPPPEKPKPPISEPY
jgi:hypothetical protein